MSKPCQDLTASAPHRFLLWLLRVTFTWVRAAVILAFVFWGGLDKVIIKRHLKNNVFFKGASVKKKKSETHVSQRAKQGPTNTNRAGSLDTQLSEGIYSAFERRWHTFKIHMAHERGEGNFRRMRKISDIKKKNSPQHLIPRISYTGAFIIKSHRNAHRKGRTWHL